MLLRQKMSVSLADVPPNLFLYLLAAVAIGFTIDGGIYSVLLNLYLLRLGFGPEFVGIINSAGLAVFAVLSLPIGSITRFSGRQQLIFGMVLLFIGILGLPLAESFIQALGLPLTENERIFFHASLLIAMRVIGMIGLAFFFVHSAPYLMSLTPDVWHSRALAWQTAALSLAGFLGGAVGGMLPGWLGQLLDFPLSHPRPYQLPLMLASLLLIPAIWALWRLPEGTQLVDAGSELTTADQNVADLGTEIGTKSQWRNILGVVLLVLLVRVLLMSGIGITNTFTNVYFDDGLGMSTERIGWLTAFGRLLGVGVALAIPFLVSRFGNYKLVMITSLLSAIGMVPIVLGQSEVIVGGAYVFITSLGALRYLAFLVFALALVPKAQRSFMSGTTEMGIGISFAVMSFIGGYMIVRFNYQVVFLGGAAIMVIGVVLFGLLFRDNPPRPRGQR